MSVKALAVIQLGLLNLPNYNFDKTRKLPLRTPAYRSKTESFDP